MFVVVIICFVAVTVAVVIVVVVAAVLHNVYFPLSACSSSASVAELRNTEVMDSAGFPQLCSGPSVSSLDTSASQLFQKPCRKNAILNISKSNQAMFHSTLHDNT